MVDMLAQATQLMGEKGLMALGAGLGAGLVTIGAAKGIGHLAGEAVGGIARQPEVQGRIFTSLMRLKKSSRRENDGLVWGLWDWATR